jgi:ABC-type bacteriocin/lantibiotic exporter with double-glycine peptidase domain
MQSKKHSLRESLTNTFIGLVINYFALFGINWLLSIQSSPGKNTLVVLFFTIISIARGYIIRRWFNRKTTSSLSGLVGKPKTSSPFGEE